MPLPRQAKGARQKPAGLPAMSGLNLYGDLENGLGTGPPLPDVKGPSRPNNPSQNVRSTRGPPAVKASTSQSKRVLAPASLQRPKVGIPPPPTHGKRANLSSIEVQTSGTKSPSLRKNSPLPSISTTKTQSGQEGLTDVEIVVYGHVASLPDSTTRNIRVFLSSTFSDMKAERNEIWSSLYPALKMHCTTNGINFNLVDMRWGVLDHATDYHQTEDIVLEEVKRCRRLSYATSFVSLIGHRYGSIVNPRTFDCNQFKILLKMAEKHSLQNTHLLTKWYTLDENNTPSVYVLQPISRLIPDYISTDAEKKSLASSQWDTENHLLHNCLCEAAEKAVAEKKLNSKFFDDLKKSVTATEIEDGILSIDEPSKTSYSVTRVFDGIENDLDNPGTQRFIDVEEDESGKKVIDKFRESSIKQFIIDPVEKKLHKNSRSKFVVAWNTGGIPTDRSLQTEEQRNFLSALCSTITNVLIKAADELNQSLPMDKEYTLSKYSSRSQTAERKKHVCDESCYFNCAVNSVAGISSAYNSLQEMDVHIPVKQKNYDEFFTHLEVCKQRSKNFISRQSELKRIRSLLQKSVFTQPLVIYGDQEVGKSSFVAKIVEEAHKSDWLGIDGVVAVRYVGLTRESGDIEGLLRSIFAQVAAAYHVCASLPQSLSRAGFRSKFSALLKSMLSNPLLKQVRPCLILIDGINHLPPQDQADLFEWIPSRLPPDVYLILTVSTKDNEVPEWLKSQEVDLMQLTPLTADQLNGLIPVILKQQNRTLTSSQLDMVKASIETCTSPLYTELVTHQASNWTSFDTDIKVPSTVEQAINQLFDRLELEYGEKLTRYVSSYLTLCKYGITENELDDVLSCTDDLLIDVYVYHAPPVPGVVRIPSHLVPMLRSQLNVYFLERKSTDLVTVIWAYRQFSDVVKKRYLSDPKQKEKCLNAIIEIFSAFNGVRRTITLSKLRNPITVENANRQIISPKLDKMTTRSLFIMAYHLAGLEKLDSFKELVAFNLEYLKAVWKKDSLKMISGLKLTLSDEELKKFSSDAELAQMRAFHSLYWLLGQEKYSDAVFADFCTHLIGYFKANPSTPHINKLLEQAEDTLRNAKCPILIEPHQSCLYSSTDYVRWLASGYNRPCTGDSDEINAVCSSSGDRVHVIDTLDNFTYSVNLPKSTTRAHIAKKKLFTISGSSAHVVALEEGNQVKGQISKNAKSKSSTTLRQLHVSKSSQLVVTADNSVVSVYKAKPLKESNKPNYQESGVLTLSGINSVDAVLTTSDEKYVVIAATISANKRVFGGITTWDYTKSGTSSRIGLPKPVLSGHMYCLPDNDRLICVTGPTEVIMVSLTQQKIMEQIYSDSIPWIDLCVYEEFCALAFDDGTCVVWDFSSTNKASLQPSAPPSCVSIFGGRILVGTVHGDIEFYSLKTFKLLITIKISHTSITALKEATAGALMALDKQENAYLFDIESLVKASQKPGSDVKYQLEPSVNGMLSTDASTLLVERPEGLPVSLYGTDNLTRVDVSASAGYTRAVLCCGQSYIVGIKSSCLAVWDLTKGQEVIPSVHADVLQSIDCFSASVDTDLVLAAGNGNLIEWRPGENNVVKTEASYTSETRAIKVSFNQDSILLCTSESKGSYSCHVIGKNDKQPVMRVELPSLSSGPFYTDKHVYYVKDGQLHETNTGPLAKKLGISDVRLVSCCPSSAAVVSSKREIFLIKQNDKMACLQLDGIGHVCDLIHLNDAYTVVVGELGTIWLVNWGKQRQAISNKVVTRLGCLKAKLSDDSKKLYVYGQLLQETRLLILDVSKPL